MKPVGWAPNLHWGWFKSGKGWAAAAWTTKGLSAFVLPRPTRAEVRRRLHECFPPLRKGVWEELPSSVPYNIRLECAKACSGKPFWVPPLDISFMTTFQQKILMATCQIPWGQYRTYGWVAQKAGCPRASRAAGQALNRNPVSLFIPCHRVIAAGNGLGGYGGDLGSKIRLLKNEGISIKVGPENDYRVEKL